MKNRSYLFITVVLLGIFVIILHLFALGNVTIKREQAYLRSGPGSYYPPIATLPEGYSVTVIEDNGGWLKVETDTLSGYISKKIIEGKKKQMTCLLRWALKKRSRKFHRSE